MMMEMRLVHGGRTVASVQGDVSEDDDLARLHGVLIAEFRRRFPNQSLFDVYDVKCVKVTEGT